MTPTGTLTVLHSLSSTADGANCYGSLVKGTDNNFYGTTNGEELQARELYLK
jgi:hypothetical protein